MIIFDTNVVHLLNPESTRADILRKLRQSGHHRVAVPWTVMEELVAHKARFYVDKHQSASRSLQKLRAETPWTTTSELEPLDLERYQEHWREEYGKFFDVIDTSGDVARQAFVREAMALPPAREIENGKHKYKVGARDASIWFSVIDYLKAHPDEDVCFVTNNTKDFGDGTVYPYPMNEDIHGLEDRISWLRDFDEVVSTFTTEVSGEAMVAEAEELLRSLSMGARVALAAVDVLTTGSPAGFIGLGTADTAVEWRNWLASPQAELLTVSDVIGHEIEDDVWYTAKSQWLLYGVAVGSGDQDVRDVACVWEVKVLFSARDGDEAPTLLTPGEPSLPDAGDEACMEVLQRLKRQAKERARLTIGELTGRLSTLERSATRNLAAQLSGVDTNLLSNAAAHIVASMPKPDIASLLPTYDFAEAITPDLPRFDFLAETAAERIAASMPTFDIAGLLPKYDYGELLANAQYASRSAADANDVDASGNEAESDNEGDDEV